MSNPRRARWLLIAGVLLLVLVLAWILFGNDDKKTKTGPDAEPWSSETLDPKPDQPSPTALPTGKNALPGQQKDDLAALEQLIGTAPPGSNRYTIRFEVGSDTDISGVGWLLPYGVEAKRGVSRHVGREWHTSATAQGRRAFAALYAYTEASGSYIWCRLTVNGRVVVEKRDTGRWAQVYCTPHGARVD